ncbi:Hypothetical predicted protein [Mytilus galloprovincialis]|nr:Hypothetical predicted protein [Mytilus galloprovincialis]
MPHRKKSRLGRPKKNSHQKKEPKHKIVRMISEGSKDRLITSTNSSLKLECYADNEFHDTDVHMVSERPTETLITSSDISVKLECPDNEIQDTDVHIVRERPTDTLITSSDISVKLECPDNEVLDTDDLLDNHIVEDTVTDEVCLHENHQLVAENIKVAHVEGKYHKFWNIPNTHHTTITSLCSRDDKYKKFGEVPNVHHGTSEDHRIDMVDSEGHQFYVALDHSYLYQPNINVVEFVLEKSKHLFDMLKKDCEQNLNEHGPFELVKRSKYVRYVDLYDTDNPTVKTCITFYDNFQAEIVVHGVQLPKSHAIWDTPGLPVKFLSTQHVQELLRTASCHQVCIGNPEPDFQMDLPFPGYYSNKPSSTFAGYREDDLGAYNKNFHYKSTIRSSYCTLLSRVERCKSCQVYRKSLHKRNNRLKKKVPPEEINWLSSTKANTALTESEKIIKLKQLTAMLTDLKAKNKNLEKILQVHGIETKLQVYEIDKNSQVNEIEMKLRVNEILKKSKVNGIGTKLQENEIEKNSQVNEIEKKLQGNEIEKNSHVNELEKKSQENEIVKNLHVNEVGQKLQGNEVGKKFQGNEVGKNLQVNEIGKKLQVNEIGKKLQVNEIEKSQVIELEKKLQVHETWKKLQVNEIEKNSQGNEVRIQITRPFKH